MRWDAPRVELGPVTIWLPTASEARCGIFEDLAELFGLETNREALRRFRKAWRASGCRGRLEIDAEADAVSILAGRDAIVEAALVIDRLAMAPYRRNVGPEDASSARAAIAAHRRPPRYPWEVGDLFGVALSDGTFVFGQVLWEQDFAASSGVRAPTCALFEHRAPTLERDLDEVVAARIIAILHVQSDHLDDQEWKVVGRRPPAGDPFAGPCGRRGAVGAVSWTVSIASPTPGTASRPGTSPTATITSIDSSCHRSSGRRRRSFWAPKSSRRGGFLVAVRKGLPPDRGLPGSGHVRAGPARDRGRRPLRV